VPMCKAIAAGVRARPAAVTGIVPAAVSARSAKPAGTFGDADPGAGFPPDPHSVTVSAGGPIRPARRGAGGTSPFTAAPEDRIRPRAGPLPRHFNAGSAAGPIAGQAFDGAADGIHDIHAGAFGPGTQSTTLNLSDIGKDR